MWIRSAPRWIGFADGGGGRRLMRQKTDSSYGGATSIRITARSVPTDRFNVRVDTAPSTAAERKTKRNFFSARPVATTTI